MSTWRDERNRVLRVRLEKALPRIFPAVVLQHALARPLIPPLPRLAVESYWRAHPVRADRLARALARRSGPPEGWRWRLAVRGDANDLVRQDLERQDLERQDLERQDLAPDDMAPDDLAPAGGLARSFRVPPTPFRETAFARGAGACCLCGQPVYRLGWHKDLWQDGTPNRRARWHACCVAAWRLWRAPTSEAKLLKRLQNRKCRVTGGRLLKTAEIDHRVPLYRVWRDHRDLPWPDLLRFWGFPNLQAINRAAHCDKSAGEAGERVRSAPAAMRP
jgi:hypothetical protein